MSTRPFTKPTPVISAGDMSGGLISRPTVTQNLSMISYQVNWAGASPDGSVAVEVSNDYSQDANTAGTWTQIPLVLNGATVTSVPITGNSGTGFIDIDSIAAYALRLVYTANSGTGSLDVIVAAKVA